MKNTLHHKSRLEHAIICRQALLTHTPHMSGVICVSDLQVWTLCTVSPSCTHTHPRTHTNAHTQAHTVNTTNAFSSTNNNIPFVLANVNIYPACLRYSGHATWLRQKLPGLTVHSRSGEWNLQQLLLQTSQTQSGIVKALGKQCVLTFIPCNSCIKHGKVNLDRDSCGCIPALGCIERQTTREGERGSE